MCVAYFLKFSVGTVNFRAYAYLWEQFEGGNKTRAGTINITTLPHLYVHCIPSRFSPYKSEICTWSWQVDLIQLYSGADTGGGLRGLQPPPPSFKYRIAGNFRMRVLHAKIKTTKISTIEIFAWTLTLHAVKIEYGQLELCQIFEWSTQRLLISRTIETEAKKVINLEGDHHAVL